MLGKFSWRLAALIVGLFVAAPAFAQEETVFPAEGGGGDRVYNLNCAAGQYLVGMKGGQGAWIDRVGIICKPMGSRGVPQGPLVESEEWGGGGGGSFHKFCRENYFVGGYSAQLTADNKRVQVLRLYCMSRDQINWPQYTMAAGSEGLGGKIFENYCPAGQIGSGLHGRSGKDVNSVALICREVVAPADSPPPPAPPSPRASPSPPEKPVKSTGKAGSPTQWQNPAGTWDVRTGAGEHLVMDLSADGQVVTGSLKTDSGESGAVEGKLYGKQLLDLHYNLPSRSGQAIVTIKGDSFTGPDKAANTVWVGTRIPGPPPAPAPPPPAPPAPPEPPPPPQQVGQVRALHDVDIYDGPGGEYHIIGVMIGNTTAPQVGRQEGWCKLGGVAAGRDGWVADDHLDGCN